MTTLARLELVLIEWVDSHPGRGWQTMEHIATASEPHYGRSVGWMLSEIEDCKVIVPDIGGEKNGDVMVQGCGDLRIPAKAVVKIAVIPTG